MLNSSSCCFFSVSGDLLSTFPTFPRAFSISASKFGLTSFFSFASGGVGRGGDLISSSLAESEGMFVTAWEVMTASDGRCASDKSRAGGRDLISFARASEINGTVDDEMTGAQDQKDNRLGTNRLHRVQCLLS
jgi:hypothetical protein